MFPTVGHIPTNRRQGRGYCDARRRSAALLSGDGTKTRAEPASFHARRPMIDERRYLTKGELADRCRVTIRTVERWMREKTCPPITRLGRRVLFAIEAVEVWELQRTAA